MSCWIVWHASICQPRHRDIHTQHPEHKRKLLYRLRMILLVHSKDTKDFACIVEDQNEKIVHQRTTLPFLKMHINIPNLYWNCEDYLSVAYP